MTARVGLKRRHHKMSKNTEETIELRRRIILPNLTK